MKDKIIPQSGSTNLGSTNFGSTGFGSTGFGSTGFQPVKEFKIYRRNLPHWQSPGSVYFITSRTSKDLVLSESARDIVFNSVLYWKDKKFNLYGAVVMPDHIHLILQPLEKEKHRQDRQDACPTSCATGRTGFQPVRTFFSLAEILHSIKSYSSNQINKVLKRSGTVWLDENFDRIVRDESELLEKMNYIMHNPVKVGLVDNPKDYKWLYLEGMQ